MPENIPVSLEGVPETLLMTLYVRARESQRPDAMLHDEKAVEMVKRLACDFSRLRMHRHDEIAVILRMRKFDGYVSEFLRQNPDGVVVHIGCGLDTRFERVAERNGLVEWFDLDLPEVIELRRRLFSSENPRYHMIAASVFEETWLQEVLPFRSRSFLFVAEGVLPYFEEAEVKSLVLRLRDHFPGAELVCDAHTPFVIWVDNLQLAYAGVKARLRWSLRHAGDVESWAEGIRLLDEWNYYQDDDLHLRAFRWVRLIPPLAKSSGILHYQLGLS